MCLSIFEQTSRSGFQFVTTFLLESLEHWGNIYTDSFTHIACTPIIQLAHPSPAFYAD
jgi:hypothetical protein